ncbi:MAG: holo-ACP synthase [Phycisphaeraceae bacterium]|nr:holo-ACP synthase [Phycisphaeraceae bacterium]
MPILGHGIDLVDTPRIERLLGEHEQRFLDRVFTVGEQAYSDSGGKMRVQRYAARFAAKEAVLKVLGTGWSGGIAWTDVEVVKEATGQPRVKLHGEAAQVAERCGVTAWHISLSHLGGHALASVIGEGG